MKPILFNTEMVRAILDGRKRCTRRIAHIPKESQCINEWTTHEFVRDDFGVGSYTGYVCKKCGYGVSPPHSKIPVGNSFLKPKYNEGDVLYVRETWAVPYEDGYKYAADYNEHDIVSDTSGRFVSISKNIIRWRPSIHMPKEAARIFLKITGVRLERLQDIMDSPNGPDNQIVQEGCKYGCDFIAVWENTIKKSERDKYGWDSNPWVWVYSFDQIIKSEALAIEKVNTMKFDEKLELISDNDRICECCRYGYDCRGPVRSNPNGPAFAPCADGDTDIYEEEEMYDICVEILSERGE